MRHRSRRVVRVALKMLFWWAQARVKENPLHGGVWERPSAAEPCPDGVGPMAERFLIKKQAGRLQHGAKIGEQK